MTSDTKVLSSPTFHDALDLVDGVLDAQTDDLVALRRRLHAAPEASGQEFITTEVVASALRDAGLEPRVMRDGVGVVVDLGIVENPGEYVAMRAELDCVMVNDDKRVPYASTRDGLCHACGHDAHTTIVLFAALAMFEQRDRLRALGLTRDIRVIFQPAEETSLGAMSMIEQGALDNVTGIIAVHVDPFRPVGSIGVRTGPITGACRSFHVIVHGRSGHSARPHEAIDPVTAAASIVTQFHMLGPRSMDSRYPLALTVSSIHAGEAFNAIPDEAVLRGTLRTARLEDMDDVQQSMENVIAGVALSTGCSCTIEFPQFSPATNNDAQLIKLMYHAASAVVGGDQVERIEVPSMGAEDFAFYQLTIPGAIVRLGAALPDPATREPLHSSHFDIDEKTLGVGARFMARSALLVAAAYES